MTTIITGYKPVDVVNTDGSSSSDTSVTFEEPHEAVEVTFDKQLAQLLYVVGFDKEGDGVLEGLLLVVQNLGGAQGFEIWRRNTFTEDKFQNLGTISVQNMKAEASMFSAQLRASLGTYNPDWLVFYDSDMDNKEEPAIYEYRVRALNYPTDFTFDIGDLIETKAVPAAELSLGTYDAGTDGSVFEYVSRRIYGTPDMDWTLGLLNPTLDFFTADQMALIGAINDIQELRVAKNPEDVAMLLKELILQFGVVAVIERVFQKMGKISEDFLRALITALEKSYNALEAPTLVGGGDALKLEDFSRIFKNTMQKISHPSALPSMPVAGGGIIKT